MLNGVVFSKSDFTHALQQYSDIRDCVVEKLCKERFFIKGEFFAKRRSSGTIEYLEGYVKHCPPLDEDSLMNVDEYIGFGNMLAAYDLSLEEYIASFYHKQPLMDTSNNETNKYVLNRSNIKLTSYLFSMKLVDFFQQNASYRNRFDIENNCICFENPSAAPTTSNTSIFYFISQLFLLRLSIFIF